MQRRGSGFFEIEAEPELYELLCWDLPGLKKFRSSKPIQPIRRIDRSLKERTPAVSFP